MADGTETIQVGDTSVRYLVDAEDSNGSAVVFEFTIRTRGRMPAPHHHDAYEETVYGLEGVATFTVDGERVDIGPGDVLCIRRGVVHHFDNQGDVDAKALSVISPGILGPEYFREVAAVLDAGGPPDVAAIGAVMRRHGLTPVPPS
jgi:quercetin dioxygenase-like cupin family protein